LPCSLLWKTLDASCGEYHEKLAARVYDGRVRGWIRLVLLVGLTSAAAASAQPGRGWGRTEPDYDGRFTFVRLRWESGFGGRRYGMSDAWNHDYPRAEQNLTMLLKELTLIDAKTDGSLILTLDDPNIFKYPVVYMWEPGFWTMSDEEAVRFREYLLKGGFAIFDDFEGDQWVNLENQMRRVLPDARWAKLDKSHPIFDSFFRMETIDFPHPMYGIHPTYYGIFEQNDPSRRLMVIANHDNDVAEYWEFFGTGLFPIDPSNEAYKLGINYMLYSLTH
jgi:hypothetical protein